MSEYVDFHYMPLEGKITGKQVLKQTEDAINDLGNKVYSLDIDQSEIDKAIEKSNEAINAANSALTAVTTGRSVWFNNVAEMVATDIEAGVTAETKGYYVANDGGNALYLIRQEKSGDVVDGGSLIALDNGNMAELVTDGTVNVKQFGAVGNGTDDDTTVFQNTSSYAQANGFVPFVGVATYKITGSVTGSFNSFGEVTITGGGTVDIINLQEVVSDVSDIRDEVVDETASAKAYSESAATSATSATNTANALINFLETKEELTAPAVDPTLTISGAAADAKVVGDDFKMITVASSNRLNLDATSDVYILSNGSETATTNFKASDYIPVIPGETLYFWSKNSSNTYASMGYRYIAAYDSAKSIMSAVYEDYVNISYTVPAGASYIRCGNANTEWAKNDLYLGSLPLAESKKYLPYGQLVPVEHEQVETNKTNIESITKPSSNKLDVNSLVVGYMTTDGVLHSDVLFVTTDYIEVSENDTLFGWGKDNGTYTDIRFRFVVAFDSSKNVLQDKGSSSTTTEYTVPSGVRYIKITMYAAEINSFTNRYVGSHSVGIDYEPYGLIVDTEYMKFPSDEVYVCRNGESILAAVKYCYDHNIDKLKVEAGTYDVISEYESYYGNTYFADYTDYSQDRFDAGIWLQNIKVTFNPGAKVVCKYTGNNSNVWNYFCAFATGNNVEIDGLVLDAENLRYGIHSDFNSGSDDTYFIMRNCDIKHVRFDGNKCIGAGFGTHVTWLFENCIFRTTGNYYAVRVHNNFSPVAQSKMIVKDCYIDGNGFFMFTSYGTSTSQSVVQVCGCSYVNTPVVRKETESSNDNITLIAWNNEVRT